MIRVRLERGGRKRERISSGRKRLHNSRHMKIVEKNYRLVAEERVQKNFLILKSLTHTMSGEDGKNFWFEVIMVDPNTPEIKADRRINWICNEKGKSIQGTYRRWQEVKRAQAQRKGH